jgi:aldehyde dehydrogenase (NAD+)
MIAEPVDRPSLHALFAEQRRRYLAAPYPTYAERRAKLAALERAIAHERAALAGAMYADFRKSRDEVELSEVVVALLELRFAIHNLGRWMAPKGVAPSLAIFGSSSQVRHEPKGVVLVVSPWNYPFYLAIVPLVAALAAGNRVIVRPSEKTPHTRAVLAAIVARAFSPADVAFVGGDVDSAEALLELPFDPIFFTGSTAVGKRVMRAAAENLSSVTLELGGKSPAIVAADADVARAAERLAWGKFLNAGQTCVAPDYVLAHESVEPALLEALRARIARMYGASPESRERTDDYCRIVDAGHFERLSKLLDASVAAGAHVEIGGERNAAERYIAPTVLSNVHADSPAMRDEIFGPILPVLRYRDLDVALAASNARPKPLALYAFTRRRRTAARILAGTSAGGTAINDTVLHLVNPHLPFGGTGESGMGNYHGYFGFQAFSHARAVMRQTPLAAAPLLAPPFGKVSRAVLAVLERFG